MAADHIEQIPADPVEPGLDPAPPALTPDPARPPDSAETLRAQYAEIAAVAAQASRLGVTIDAADAMRKGIRPDALRTSVLDALASRSEATSVIATAPRPHGTAESPIVRRARERAGQSQK